MPSLSFRERMSGNYWLLDAPAEERALALSFEAHTTELGEFLRTRTWALAGTIDAEGLARRREIEGSVRYALLEERRVPYRFAFRGDDGRRYELVGQKEWVGLAPVSSMTLLPATLVDDRGQELARATLRFDLLADWAEWVKSFRLRLGA
ncbi:MAG TPA: hypothetical protein VH044_20400 [Polyangiaceae bacterium]|jgi:hypothetical protein|nr:hypothetical protein [Polyangiaceae bacterium]